MAADLHEKTQIVRMQCDLPEIEKDRGIGAVPIRNLEIETWNF